MIYLKRLKGAILRSGLSRKEIMNRIRNGFSDISERMVLTCHYFCVPFEEYSSTISIVENRLPQKRDTSMLTGENMDILEQFMKDIISKDGKLDDCIDRNKRRQKQVEDLLTEFNDLVDKDDDESENRKQQILSEAIDTCSDEIDDLAEVILLFGSIPLPDPYEGGGGEDEDADGVFDKFISAVEFCIDSFSSVVGLGERQPQKGLAVRMPPPGSPGWEGAIARLNAERERTRVWRQLWNQRRLMQQRMLEDYYWKNRFPAINIPGKYYYNFFRPYTNIVFIHPFPPRIEPCYGRYKTYQDSKGNWHFEELDY